MNPIADIVLKVLSFDKKETIFTDLSVISHMGDMILDLKIAKNKNNILLFGGSVTGDININLNSGADLSSEDANVYARVINKNNVNCTANNIDSGILKTVSMLQSSSDRDTLVLLYSPPLSTEIKLDRRLIMTYDAGTKTTTIKTLQFNDLAIPGGKSMILIITKNDSLDNLNINITRPSYKNILCYETNYTLGCVICGMTLTIIGLFWLVIYYYNKCPASTTIKDK
jgi:hypothetical protein